MLKVTCDIVGISPISFSRPIQSPKNTGETSDAHETRTWRERIHQDDKGQVFIPPTALKNCLAEVAKYLSESVPGKGKSTYTKHFEAGVLVTDPLMLGVKADSVQPERLFVPADGKRGGGKRVWKMFPTLLTWQTEATLYILDPVIADKPEKVLEYLGHAGRFIGMGRFRPRNNGYYGRFKIENFKSEKVEG